MDVNRDLVSPRHEYLSAAGLAPNARLRPITVLVGQWRACRFRVEFDSPRNARFFFGATSFVVFAGLILQVVLSATSDGGSFGSVKGKVFNFFCFFTVQSNIIVAITTGMLALKLNRTSVTFDVFRLVGVIAIAVTGVVFHLALRDLQELTGWDALADFLLHTASPILSTIGWLTFGPRRRVSWRVIRLAAIPPLLWLVFTLVRGSFVQDVHGKDYYPYPFMNVQEHGYATVVVNSAIVVVLFIALCSGALALDRKLPVRSTVTAPPN